MNGDKLFGLSPSAAYTAMNAASVHAANNARVLHRSKRMVARYLRGRQSSEEWTAEMLTDVCATYAGALASEQAFYATLDAPVEAERSKWNAHYYRTPRNMPEFPETGVRDKLAKGRQPDERPEWLLQLTKSGRAITRVHPAKLLPILAGAMEPFVKKEFDTQTTNVQRMRVILEGAPGLEHTVIQLYLLDYYEALTSDPAYQEAEAQRPGGDFVRDFSVVKALQRMEYTLYGAVAGDSAKQYSMIADREARTTDRAVRMHMQAVAAWAVFDPQAT